MSSGIRCREDVKEEVNELIMNKKYRYICFKIVQKENSRLEEIIVDDEPRSKAGKCEGKTAELLDDLKGLLMEGGQPRYVLLDVREPDYKGKVIAKPIFISWIQDDHNVKLKMKYASTQESLKKEITALSGLKTFQASEPAELNIDDVLKHIT